MVKDSRILAHFRRHDPTLFSLFQSIILDDLPVRQPRHYFVSLCREIIGQQLSGRVADVIFDRFERLFPKRKVTPASIQKISDENLRKTGMSWSKVRFIRALSLHVHEKRVDLAALGNMTGEQVITTLTKVKGIGPWTAEMFLIFTLGRPDVFSYGDLGLRKAIQKLYKLRHAPTQKQMERIVKKWKPYRTYGARLLWKYLDLT